VRTLGPPLWKRYFLAGLLALLHCALVIFVMVGVSTSSDPEAWMALAVFDYVDHPVLPLAGPFNLYFFIGGIFIAGGLLWFCYGCVFQSLVFIRRPGNWLRLSVSALLVGLLWMIPAIQLTMKPRWESAWNRAWKIGRGRGTDSDKAIQFVSEAIHYSPKDNKDLPMLWDYLGNLYIDQENYPLAESIFRGRLANTQAQPSPNPKDLLDAYHSLDAIYFKTGNTDGRKECLEKVIELTRVVKGGDSVQEAGAWQSLAKLTHDAGNPRDGAEMLQRAITMYSTQHVGYVPYDYLNRTVAKWKRE
jgi:hypothetical protein